MFGLCKNLFLHPMGCHVTMTVYLGHMIYYVGYMTFNGGLTNAGANSWVSQ